jgi:small-conductance mechanosensitive channel
MKEWSEALMTKGNHTLWVILLLACVLLLGSMLFASNMLVSNAQDASSTPAPTVESTPDAAAVPQAGATPETAATPEADVPPEAEATTGADSTSAVEDVASEAFSGIQDLTWQEALKLLLWVVVIFLAVIYGSRLVYTLLRQLAKRTPTTFDDALVEVIRPQIRWLIAAIGFQIATIRLEFITGIWQSWLQFTYFLLYWFVATATIWRSIDFSEQWYIERKGPDIDANLRDQLLPLAARLAHICLIFVAIGVLLGYFGVDLLATAAVLGLGGFALSLAAKDTITNVISGIVIMFDSPFAVGDRIDVPAAGTWGDVVDIGIRSTRVLTRDNRLVIIPNSVVADGEVINYSEPDPSYRLQVDLGIGYNGNIPWITEVLEDTVRGVEGVMENKPVNVLFTGFGDAGMDFRVRWWVSSPGEKRSVTHRVCAAIQDITVEKDIDMPNATYSLVNTFKISPEDAAAISIVPGTATGEADTQSTASETVL